MTGKMKRTAEVVLAAVMTLSLAFSQGVPVCAESETITVANTEDLIKLAKNCRLDTWSQGKTVVLTADLDLTDLEFKSIPTFGGTFDGGGHTISGLSFQGDGSNEGFFRYVQESATVKNLHIKGSLAPTGSKKNIGGIAGSNSGQILSCTFDGTIKAETNVGGIVGINEQTGSIYNSSASGNFSGTHSTGGIAGRNLGQLINCSNEAEINTGDYEAGGSLENLNLDTNLKQLTGDDKASEIVNTTTDTGGICGYSSGAVQNCTNEGKIGYPHIGYNVGGVAGRSSGYLSGNQNYGSVEGRKDVGGVTGQMAPDLTLRFDEDKIEELRGEINKLGDLVDNALGHMDHSRSGISSRMDKISGYTDDAKSSAKSLTKRTTEWADTNIEKISKSEAAIKAGVEDAREALTQLSRAAGSLNEEIRKINDILDTITGPAHKDELDSVKDSMNTASDKLASASGKASDALKQYDSDKDVSKLITGLSDAADDMNAGLSAWNDAQKKLGDLLGDPDVQDAVQKALDGLGSMSSEIEEALTAMKAALEKMGADISGMDLSFEKFGDDYRADGERLYAAVGGISEQLEKLGDQISDMTEDTIDDFRKINTQFSKVMNTMLDLVTDANDTSDSIEDKIVDVSDEEIEKTTRGKAYGCQNFGEIEGDVNVGGIAGSMAIEYDTDPEDDISKIGEGTLNFTLETKAIIQHCANKGEITSKKDNAGGVVGNMALGLVVDSEGYGSALSTNGNYVGGIAGYSVSQIRRSYAKCTLEGGNYVGGIAGYGRDIKDCYSLIEVTEADEYIGSIAGDRDGEGELSGNYFVGDAYGAVDDISYGGKAEPADFETVAATAGIPSDFLNFELRFVADGQVLKQVPFKYGADLSDVEYPDIPKKDGYNGKWEEADLSDMTFSKDLDVLYTTESTAVASDQMRDLAHSTLLAEGTFSLDAKLVLVEAEEDTEQVPTRGRVLEQWTSTLRDPILTDSVSYKLRFIAPEMKGKPGLYRLNEDGSWKKLSYQKDGSYLVFDADSAEITFCVTEEPGGILLYILSGAAVVILLIVLLVIKKLRKKRKNRKMENAQAAEDEDSETPEETGERAEVTDGQE